MSEAWKDLVDPDRLAAWMDAQGLHPGAPIDAAAPLTGGTQNLLLRFQRGGRGFVLRRPPRHPRSDGTDTMRREALVLAALARTDVPHARLIAACDDPGVLGAGFYLMEPVDGFNPTAGLPAVAAGQPHWCHRMGLAMAHVAADIGRVDPAHTGLPGAARLDGWIARQAPRWQAQLDSYAQFTGWPGPSALPGVSDVLRWLAQHPPGRFQGGLLHGDFHFANVLFREDAPQLAAVVDWELASLGDPLLDLGWLIATWPDADGHSAVPLLDVRPWVGFPDVRELADAYARRSGRDLNDLDWFVALACVKLAVILEGTHARAHAGHATMEMGTQLHASACRLLARALERIESS